MKYLILLINLLIISIIGHAQTNMDEEPLSLIKESKLTHRFDFTVQDIDRANQGYYGNDELVGGLSAEYTLGYELNRFFNPGFGLGVQRLSGLTATSFPIYLNVIGYLFERKFTPFYSLKFGKLIIPNQSSVDGSPDINYSNTWLFHPEFGLKISDNASVGIGFRINSYKEVVTYSERNVRSRDKSTRRYTMSYYLSF